MKTAERNSAQIVSTASSKNGAAKHSALGMPWLSSERGQTVMDITPEIAQWYLDNLAPGQRSRGRNQIDKIKRDLVHGDFDGFESNDALCLNEQKRGVNGVHRCTACVETGITLRDVTVKWGLRSILQVDGIRPRSFADVLQINGEASSKHLAAAVAMVWRSRKGALEDKWVGMSKAEGDALLASDPKLRESMHVANRAQKILALSTGAGLHYLFAEKDAPLAEWFFDKLATGIDLDGTDAVYHLRERLKDDRAGESENGRRSKKERLTYKDKVALCVLAWNYTRDNKPTRNLRWRSSGTRPQPFPAIK